MEHAECVVTEVVGTSDESVEAAILDGMGRAGHALEWFEVTGVQSTVLDSTERFRVGLRVGLRTHAA